MHLWDHISNVAGMEISNEQNVAWIWLRKFNKISMQINPTLCSLFRFPDHELINTNYPKGLHSEDSLILDKELWALAGSSHCQLPVATFGMHVGSFSKNIQTRGFSCEDYILCGGMNEQMKIKPGFLIHIYQEGNCVIYLRILMDAAMFATIPVLIMSYSHKIQFMSILCMRKISYSPF